MQKEVCAYEADSNEILTVFTVGSPLGDYVEIRADLDLKLEECDYGVSGSPVWLEVYDYDIDCIYINEDSYTLKELKAKYSDIVVTEVLAYIDDAVDKVELY